MKKVILLFLCIGTMYCSFAQEIPSKSAKPTLTKEEYLKKSRGQKIGAIVMVSIGGLMTLSGIAVGLNDLENLFEESNNAGLTGVLIIGGVATMLGSIGLTVSSHINKKRALSVSFKSEPFHQLQKSTVVNKPIPSINLKISL